MRRMILLTALLLAAAAPARALNEQAGTSGAQFLKLGSGARAGAMADSFSAVADDASAAYYNPAGLTQLQGAQLAGAHTAYIQGMSYEVLQFAYPFSRQEKFSRHSLALGIYYLSISNLERRTGDSTDAVGTFGASDGAYALSYAYAVDGRLSLGATGKYISQELDTYHASAMAADLGTLYKLNPDGKRPMTASFVLRNLGTRPKFAGGESDPLPVSGTLGLGLQALPKKLRVSVDVTKYRDADLFAAAGGEYVHQFQDGLSGAFRAGYSSQRRDLAGLSGLTVGGGLGLQKASFDFAWVPFGDLGNTFRFSLLVKF